MYLGKLFCFQDMHDLELKNRVAKAWFHIGMYKAELTDRHLDLKTRMKLFKSVVQPTFLYGCASRTLTCEREQFIQSTQRRLMRQIVRTRRCMLNGEVEAGWAGSFEPRVWQRKLKLTMAFRTGWKKSIVDGTVARRNDGRWTKEILHWNVVGKRRQGRSFTRWSCSFSKFFAHTGGGENHSEQGLHEWMELGEDAEAWSALESDYVRFVLSR